MRRDELLININGISIDIKWLIRYYIIHIMNLHLSSIVFSTLIVPYMLHVSEDLATLANVLYILDMKRKKGYLKYT